MLAEYLPILLFIGVAAVMGVAMVIFDLLLPFLRPLRWPFVAAGVALYGLLAEIALQGGIVGLVGRFTLNPATAYIRRMQWKYGGETVLDNPLFGIGFAIHDKPAWLTDAIDAHFLLLALRFGLIPPVLLALGVGVVMFTAVMVGILKGFAPSHVQSQHLRRQKGQSPQNPHHHSRKHHDPDRLRSLQIR